jgi:DNA-binding transcriptional ArsR family regulator
MQDVQARSRLLPVLRSPLLGELLAWLYLHPEQQYSVTELARRFGVSQSTISREVDRLAEAELVLDERRGNLRLLREPRVWWRRIAVADLEVGQPSSSSTCSSFGQSSAGRPPPPMSSSRPSGTVVRGLSGVVRDDLRAQLVRHRHGCSGRAAPWPWTGGIGGVADAGSVVGRRR